jgi:hypothetical protein
MLSVFLFLLPKPVDHRHLSRKRELSHWWEKIPFPRLNATKREYTSHISYAPLRLFDPLKKIDLKKEKTDLKSSNSSLSLTFIIHLISFIITQN